MAPADSWVEVGDVPSTGTNAGVATTGPSAVVLGTPAPHANAITGISDFLNDDFGDDAPATGNDSNFRGYQNTFTPAPGQTVSLVHFVVVGTSETAATAGQLVLISQAVAYMRGRFASWPPLLLRFATGDRSLSSAIAGLRSPSSSLGCQIGINVGRRVLL